MKAAALLVLVLSNQGYWLSGQELSVTAHWAAKEKMPAADIVWELGLGDVKLGGATIAMNGADQPTTITLQPPDVRVRTTLRWRYRLVQRDGARVLEAGELPVHAFPADLTGDWAARLGRKKLVVWDDDDGLPKILADAKVPFTRVNGLSEVFTLPDLILIGPGRLGRSTFDQTPLINLARAGSSIAVFAQAGPEQLAGYPLARRELPDKMQFRAEHPLFDRLDPIDLKSWTSDSRSAPALRLPADAAALELAWWSREAPGEPRTPIDAWLLTRTMDSGRIVFCQMPLGGWRQDPRSQIFLGNLISYLTTRPEPTPPPEQRCPAPKAIKTQSIPAIIAPPGAQP